MGFVHLHFHSQFHHFNGMPFQTNWSKLEEFEMLAVAMTDTCNLFGAVDSTKLQKSSETYLSQNLDVAKRHQRTSNYKRTNESKTVDGSILIENKAGYHTIQTDHRRNLP